MLIEPRLVDAATGRVLLDLRRTDGTYRVRFLPAANGPCKVL
jgi:hypothetical protein